MMAAETVALAGKVSGHKLSARARQGDLFRDLEKKIAAAGLTVEAVCRRAGLTSRHYRRFRAGTHMPSRHWIKACELAVEALLGGDPTHQAEPSDRHVLALFNGFLGLAAQHYQVDMDQARRAAQGPAVKARHLALYLVNTELSIRHATLARLFGVTRAAMTMAVREVEDRREDKAFDQAVTAMAARISGRT